VIDGSSQPGWAGAPIIEINGASAGTGTSGLYVPASGSESTIRGLIINRFDGSGIYGLSSADLVIRGNYIGTDASGTVGLGNNNGIYITGSSRDTIGGTTSAERNVISGNTYDGIYLSDVRDSFIQGNYIGTQASGTGAIPNGQHGIHLDTNSSRNMIGGTASGAGNLIASNTGGGIAIGGSDSVSNTILSNSIADNAWLGLDLGMDGVTANDADDADTGPNNLLNFPVIYSVTISGGNVTIIGEARPGATVEFFEAAADPTGYGEGQTFVGSAVEGSASDSNETVGMVDDTANQFTFTFAVGSLDAGDPVTATATDASGNTSEFALNVTA
jgi:parallel beta-helix repeat protein